MLRRKLSNALFRTRAVMLFERLYAGLAPLFVVCAIFFGLALFGLFGFMPGWLHVLSVALGAGALVWAIVTGEPRLKAPSHRDARQRLEDSSDLPQGLLADLEDVPLNTSHTSLLWKAHQHQLEQSLNA